MHWDSMSEKRSFLNEFTTKVGVSRITTPCTEDSKIAEEIAIEIYGPRTKYFKNLGKYLNTF